MDVIGIDFGSDTCMVTGINENHVEVILNDYHERRTPSYVAFCERKREFGTAAKNQQVVNPRNTIRALKNNLVQKNSDESMNYTVRPHSHVLFQVHYKEDEVLYNGVQIAGMLLKQLKLYAEKYLSQKHGRDKTVSGCMMSVPSYFTSYERNALLVAAGIAGLNCHKLVKETTAAAIDYGFYKKFPSPVNVVFIDFGHNAVQASICRFNDVKFEMLTEECDLFGGKDIDLLLANHFITLLKNKNFPIENESFNIELLEQVEKLKKNLSADSADLPLNIGHLLNDNSISLSLDRSKFEEICQPLFDRFETLLSKLLKSSRLTVDEINAIELIGGSSRIFKVKELVEKIFKKAPRTTMNQEEAIAKGCLLHYFLSRTKKVLYENPNDLKKDGIKSKSLLQISKLHSNYKDSNGFCVYTNPSEFEVYINTEISLQSDDQYENHRCFIRNELEEFINLESLSGGVFENIQDNDFKETLKIIRHSPNESGDFYLQKLVVFKLIVESKKSQKAQDELSDFSRKDRKSADSWNKCDIALKLLLDDTRLSNEAFQEKASELKNFITTGKEKIRSEAYNNLRALIEREFEEGGIWFKNNDQKLKNTAEAVLERFDLSTEEYLNHHRQWSEKISLKKAEMSRIQLDRNELGKTNEVENMLVDLSPSLENADYQKGNFDDFGGRQTNENAEFDEGGILFNNNEEKPKNSAAVVLDRLDLSTEMSRIEQSRNEVGKTSEFENVLEDIFVDLSTSLENVCSGLPSKTTR